MVEYEWFTPEQKEVHRIQNLILKEIYTIDDKLVFKGGTALELVYGLDRFSADLDFNTNIENIAEINSAIEALDSRVMHVENDWGAEIKRSRIMHVYVLDFFSELIGTRLAVKIDAVFDKCAVEPKRKTISVEGSPLTMPVMDEAEILAEKAIAIMNEKRNQPRDLYDLKFLLTKNTPIDLHLIYLKSQSSVFGNTRRYSFDRFAERVNTLEEKWPVLKPYLRDLPRFKDVSGYVLGKFKAVQ